MQNQKKSGSSWTGYAGLCLGILLIAYLFSQVDLQGAVERISLIGFSSLFILLPYLGLHVLESIAWFMLFPGSTVPISFFKLLKIQLIAETVSMTLPAGVAVGEPFVPFSVSGLWAFRFRPELPVLPFANSCLVLPRGSIRFSVL